MFLFLGKFKLDFYLYILNIKYNKTYKFKK